MADESTNIKNMLFEVLIILVSIIVLYYIIIRPYTYWSNKNVRTGPIIPIFGDTFHLIFGKETFPAMFQRICNKFPTARYIGTYQFMSPALVVKCPDLLKDICVKDFEHFMDHRLWFAINADEVFAKGIFQLKGEHWKYVRYSLSPSFTSSKLKAGFTLMCQNATRFVQHFLDKNQEVIDIDLKDTTTRFSMDIIANIALGLKVDSLKNKDDGFYVMLHKAVDLNTLWAQFVFFCVQVAPSLSDSLGLAVFGDKVKNFFVNLVRDTIQLRKDKNIKRLDLLDYLIEARERRRNKGNEEPTEATDDLGLEEVQKILNVDGDFIELTDSEIASNVFTFLFGGFDTVGTAMYFMAYELAINPHIQARLIEEIDENRDENGSISHESIISLPYLDMVISESLRKWPSLVFTDRRVSKPYIIQPKLPNEQPVHLEVGDIISIPIHAIHHNPKFYDDPEKFDPERFSIKNRKNINPYTYMPFGIGPRNCIGYRFALLEIKTVFFYLLSNFEIIPVEKTPIPLAISRTSVNMKSEVAAWIGLKRRDYNIIN